MISVRKVVNLPRDRLHNLANLEKFKNSQYGHFKVRYYKKYKNAWNYFNYK